jgi:DGQHR domain-containing protein
LPGTISRDLASAKNETERRVGDLLTHMGLTLVGVDAEVQGESGRLIGEVDLVCQFEDVILLAEVTHRARAETVKVDRFFTRWLDNTNLNRLLNICGLPAQPVVRVFFEMNQDRPPLEPESLAQYLQRSNEPCSIIYKDDFQYFLTSLGLIGRWAVNDFLAFVGWPRGANSTRVPAIQFYIGERHAYSFAIKATLLLQSSYIYRRLRKEGRVQDLGYQRALDPGRMSKIARYVQQSTPLAFPNSIILSSGSKLLENPKAKHECPARVDVQFPISFCSNRIVDGQHRVYAFSQANRAIQDAHFLPVVAFDDLTSQDELALFIDINSTQKRVERNLILALRVGFPWPPGTREYYESVAVQVCVKLAEGGALKDKIYFGGALEKSDAKVKLNTLVGALLSSNLIGGKVHLYQATVDDIEGGHRKVAADFHAMVTSPLSPAAKGFFMSNQGIRVMMRAIQVLERNRRKEIVDVPTDLFFQMLGHIMDTTFIDQLRDFYGEGGASRALELVFTTLKNTRRPGLKRRKQLLSAIETDLKKLRIPMTPSR